MNLRNQFEDNSKRPHSWNHTFGDQMSPQDLNDLQEDLQRMADFFKIDIQIKQTDNGFNFGFNSFSDYAWFRKCTGNMVSSKGDFEWAQNFDPPNSEYQAAWVKGMKESMDFYGIECELEEKDGQVKFKFNNFDDYAWFGEMVEDGFADHKADIMLAHMRMQNEKVGYGWGLRAFDTLN